MATTKRKVAQKFDYFCVLDFEATCEKNNRNYNNEIIEFPVVLVNASTLTIEKTFQLYLKPTINPTLTDFCKKLTGITQEQVDGGVSLQEALSRFDAWQRENIKGSWAFVTDGPWDLRDFLSGECTVKKIKTPHYCNKWVNMRWLWGDFYAKNRRNITRMLGELGMTFEGNPHSGIDDARNIARITIRMMQDGCVLKINDSLAKPIDGRYARARN